MQYIWSCIQELTFAGKARRHIKNIHEQSGVDHVRQQVQTYCRLCDSKWHLLAYAQLHDIRLKQVDWHFLKIDFYVLEVVR